MSPEVLSILVLAVIFVLATTRSINMGALAFAAAFGVGTLAAGMNAEEIFAGFPGDLFVVLVGVTYLFAIARANGTTDWLVHASVRLVGGRVALIPWVMFAVTGALTAIGAVSPAAVAIVAPLALGFAAQYGIKPLLMGALVVHGAQAGGFSPISIYGSTVNGIVAREHLPGSPVALFAASLVVNLLIAAVLFVALGGLRLPRTGGGGRTQSDPDEGRDEGRSTPDGGRADSAAGALALTPARIATLIALLALVVAVLVLDLDAGLTAITLAVVLSAVWPQDSKAAVAEITWPTVLLICGVLTYVGVLDEMGTITWAGHAVGGIGIPLLAALLLCYIGALVSAFASSVGIIGALIPLAVPFLAQGSIGAVGMVAALAVSATVVDVSPFSTNGALVLANAKNVDRDGFFKQLMVYGALVVAAVPALVWLALVVPGFG
ncbi:SLC13 family permease [Streptomyces ochraceiscleroticus]|uniref:SLC13 family permease n=1 Tax=Streptomyces ochraceiscleroticus TaxID=47761 RepID=A0ABW1MGS8_9ACTN|nr:SLC13 family permease [Streptomyces ochraceiscleroticus]